MALNVRLCIDTPAGEQLALLRLCVPVNLTDSQVEDIMGGKPETTRETFLSCKTVLISALKAGTNQRALRDADKRRNDLRQKALSILSTDAAYAAELLKDADAPQFHFEEIEELLTELAFALSILNKDAYLVFDHTKEKARKGGPASGIGSILNNYSEGIPIPEPMGGFQYHQPISDGPADYVGYNPHPAIAVPPSPAVPVASVGSVGSVGSVTAMMHSNTLAELASMMEDDMDEPSDSPTQQF